MVKLHEVVVEGTVNVQLSFRECPTREHAECLTISHAEAQRLHNKLAEFLQCRADTCLCYLQACRHGVAHATRGSERRRE